MKISGQNKFRVLVALGTRPEAVKLAPLIHALKAQPQVRCWVCNTAQHRQMSEEILRLFKVRIDFDLNVMRRNQSLVYLQNTIGERFSPVLEQCKPDLVIVQGDTTTAFETAVLAFYHKIPIAHIEAGLRTFDKYDPFPEEMNRRLISTMADLHFAPTLQAYRNLIAEGIARRSVHRVGNTVVDALSSIAASTLQPGCRKRFERKYPRQARKLILVTAHRRDNWGARIEELCATLKEIALRDDVEIIWPVHPNPKVKLPVTRALRNVANIRLVSQLPYDEFVYLLTQAEMVITDSGGVQEEAASLGKPVIVFRKRTERPEVLTANIGQLAPDRGSLRQACARLLGRRNRKPAGSLSKIFGDGQSSERIVNVIIDFLRQRRGES